jgi:hypothetical protein
LPRDVSGSDAVKVLRRFGFAFARQAGSHGRLVLGPEKPMEVHRQPPGGQYAKTSLHAAGEFVTCLTVPEFTVDPTGLFTA